jgi:FKBP-type peptidyl-prolyl cis-trans isomerase (trigger factor)
VKPDVERVLEVCAVSLMTDVAPNVAPPYRQASVFATAILLTSIREELDRSAARRVEENRAMRELFADALESVADSALRARLEEVARAEETSFRISDLEAANAALRQVLIELQAHVETLDSPAARRVEASIWRELAASTQRRKLSLGAF